MILSGNENRVAYGKVDPSFRLSIDEQKDALSTIASRRVERFQAEESSGIQNTESSQRFL